MTERGLEPSDGSLGSLNNDHLNNNNRGAANGSRSSSSSSSWKRQLLTYILLITLALICLIQLGFSAIYLTTTVDANYSRDMDLRTEQSHTITTGDDDELFLEWSKDEQQTHQILLEKSKTIIPEWMAKYVTWHQEQRRILDDSKISNDTATNNMKFMVVRCIENQKCGGLSDRMKPLPFYLMVANLTQRVLLFHWTKPSQLENFLIPSDNGIDWSIEGTPVTLQEVRNNTNYVNGHASSLSYEVRMWAGKVDGGDRSYLSTCKVLNVLLDGGGSITEAQALFNHWRKEPGQSLPSWSGGGYLGWNPATSITQREMLEDVWRLLFQPSPGVQRAIFDQMRDLSIAGEKFNAVQVRAKDPRLIPSDTIEGSLWELDMLENYNITPKLHAYFEHRYNNAIACLQDISNETELPIYLASDSKFGKSYYDHSSLPIRISNVGKGDPLHIDSDRYQGRDPLDFYQAFVDVYIMQKASCYSHSGGFGLLPLRLNNNLTECEATHTNQECQGKTSFEISPTPSSNFSGKL